MTRTIAICQPHYLPWMGYFDLLDRADLFVFLDDAQFSKGGWHNRNRIRKTETANEAKWLSVAIKKGPLQRELIQVETSTTQNWLESHLAAIHETYRKAPFFDAYFGPIGALLAEAAPMSLGDLNIRVIEGLCELIGIRCDTRRSSQLGVPGEREKRLLDLCKALQADRYLANDATGNYVEASYFLPDGIEFVLQRYSHPTYTQNTGRTALPFLSHLSVIDLLFNHGQTTLDIIRSGSCADGDPAKDQPQAVTDRP